jgi:soluble lytic murein transglycosylase
MISIFTKIFKVIPGALIIATLGCMGYAATGHSVLFAAPGEVEHGTPAPLAREVAPFEEIVTADAGDDEDEAEDDGAVIHLPQISEILNAAPEIPAMKIELPPPAPLVVQPAPETIRVEHARELLGKFYNRSVVKNGEKIAQVGKFVRERTRKVLQPQFKKYAKAIADAVLKEGDRHGFDPVFLMAVIENESSFNPHIVGSVGEVGLMQLTPTTAAWIAKKNHIKYAGKKSLRDPKTNIRLGAAYLAYLREQFDSHSRLYLAAYNMGSLNVNRALGHSIWPKDYPRRVMKRYIRYYGDLKTELKLGSKLKLKSTIKTSAVKVTEPKPKT